MGPMSDRPLMEILKQFHQKKKICIFYGNSDWMDSSLSMELFSNNDLELECEIIEDCGHQMIFQNPKSVSSRILHYYNKFLKEDEEDSNDNDDSLNELKEVDFLK